MLALFAVAAGGAPPAYIEDVFSTWLYTGTGATQTITNGVDLSGNGGLTWIKSRSYAEDHCLFDTARGALNVLYSDTTDGSNSLANSLTAFTSTGFTLGSRDKVNTSAATYASWTLREQSKFFDIVTYTGTGSNRTISHNLGAVPGSIIVKRTDATGAWQVYHRSLANTEYLVLNTTAAKATDATLWNSTTPTSTAFSLGTNVTVNASGGTYVAYIFAHDAGGFGQAGTDNAISCGSYVKDGSGNATVTLGYEPQWIIAKPSSTTGRWYMYDTMRNMSMDTGALLSANVASAESSFLYFNPTATGFNDVSASDPGETYVYIAIRRGPMRVPTSGTSVFSPNTFSAAGTFITTNFVVDTTLTNVRAGSASNTLMVDRLRGALRSLVTSSTAAESTAISVDSFTYNNGYLNDALSGNQISYAFRRAPNFFDEICYTGTGSDITLNHNLTVAPELIIAKRRSGAAQAWYVTTKFTVSDYLYLNLNSNIAASTVGYSSSDVQTAKPTATQLTFGQYYNTSGATYVVYLFATCAGVSKVGSYTGTGTTLQINCGFTAGSRFVLIKRTDDTGDWYVWDSARGIIAGNDPYLLLNSTAAEVTSTDYVDTYAAGFELSSTAPAAINASGGTYIFLAIA
tara:strand:+ start:619 stop:2508 length:1890 start_codon:yes stop_codon:yes gene_type:complete